MKFNKIYNTYLEKYLNEGMLGSIAAAIPRTVGYIAKDIATAGLKDNLIGQAFGQVRQQQAGERESQRTKEGKVLDTLKEELMNDPNFIKKKINFEFDAGRGLTNEQKSYNELSDFGARADRDKIRVIKKIIAEVDLNDASFNLYNNNVQSTIKQKILEVIQKINTEDKQDLGQDYKKVKTDSQQVLTKLERMINDTLKPLGVGKSVENKVIWLFILAAMSGSTPTIKL